MSLAEVAVAVPEMQRARGLARVALAPRAAGAAMRLVGLHQSGAAKVFLPRIHAPVPEVVYLNTAGGLARGDRLGFELSLAPGAQAVGTTQTAERVYGGGRGGIASTAAEAAEMQVTLTLGAGARLDWLPQETILYDGSALARRTRADLGPGATLLMAEMLVLGRAAMGETVGRLALQDRREIWREGRPLVIEPLALGDSALDRPGAAPRGALLDGARAIATIVLAGCGAETAAGPLRAALSGLEGAEAQVSGWDGRCIVRLRAGDGLELRRAVARALAPLRGNRALPRVWQL